MPDPRYTIDWEPPDISAGAGLLLGVLEKNRAHDLAQMNAETQRQYAENTNRRESAQEKRNQQTYEQGQADRRQKAIESANELRRQGRHSEADMLLKLHGVVAAPIMGEAKTTAPEVVTPMSAASRLTSAEVPPMEDTSFKYVSPMAAAANTVAPPEHHGVGVTVPEEPPAMPPVAASEVTPAEDHSAASDLLPYTIPGETQPGAPTGAYRYTGPNGEDLGRFDPAEEKAFREKRAAHVTDALGPLGEKVVKIADLLAANEISDKEAGALFAMVRSAESETEREKARNADREDKQRFEELMKKLYSNEPITIADRNRWEAMRAHARAASSGAVTAPPAAMDVLSRYAIENPGDQPGLHRLAGTLGIENPEKAVAAVLNQTKSTESQSKDAKQAAIGLRAIDAIGSAGYTPSREDIQKWLNNQRQVYQAQRAGEGGGIGGLVGGYVAGKAQEHGVLAQSEVEGLPPKAANYFANVRRFMETIGRAQSGAAISPTEWQNFFNQYGPNSPGGLDAARQYMNDQLRASGVAGRTLAPPTTPKTTAPVRSVRMPDGTVQSFDANGKRVE